MLVETWLGKPQKSQFFSGPTTEVSLHSSLVILKYPKRIMTKNSFQNIFGRKKIVNFRLRLFQD